MLDQALAGRAATPRTSLRDTAAAILAAWDDQAARFGTHDGDLIGALEAPMAALRAALAGKPIRIQRDANTPRKPREGTKQEQVLAMLRRPEGATVAQIAEATGWAQHTVRGFFAGLKKKGHTVEVLERTSRSARTSRAPRAATASTALHLPTTRRRWVDVGPAHGRLPIGGRALPGLDRRAGPVRPWAGGAAGKRTCLLSQPGLGAGGRAFGRRLGQG